MPAMDGRRAPCEACILFYSTCSFAAPLDKTKSFDKLCSTSCGCRASCSVPNYSMRMDRRRRDSILRRTRSRVCLMRLGMLLTFRALSPWPFLFMMRRGHRTDACSEYLSWKGKFRSWKIPSRGWGSSTTLRWNLWILGGIRRRR